MKKQKNKNLTDKMLKKIKEELIKREKEIFKDLKDISTNKDNRGSSKVKFPDFGDKTDENAQEIGEYTTNIAKEKLLKITLRDIKNSLKRIRDGEYGICKYCKKEINIKRLEARPVASACIECKTKLQNKI